ncbi:NHL repeat-containing protein [Mucilaginibacter pedocola]|uniref:Fibronectin type-III domain-containing protein n=1 Tax=Mucilaginibacter pedocola TaxID=1792845 RepID=A0A1S9PGY6_9SPHI|nr:hypothetical protein [Mucilaginibacter pedocola]OOQ60222.1 hypothetical protein BC343_26045 [Mucilaginibacter pedocola]
MKPFYFITLLAMLCFGCGKNNPVTPVPEKPPVLNILSAPTGLSATKGAYDDKVVVSWAKVTGAKKYQVYRSANAETGFELFTETADTTINDEAGEAHVNRYYKVKIYNSAAEYSALSPADFGFKLSKTYSLWYSFGSMGRDSGKFVSAKHVATDAAGNIFVADEVNSLIQKFSRDGKYITNLMIAPVPRGMLALRNGNLFTTNVSPSTASIAIFNPEGFLVGRWGWSFQYDEKLESAEEVAEDDERKLYIVDGQTNLVKRYDTTGLVTLKFNGAIKTPGQATDAYPFGVTCLNGEVFVTSPNNTMVRVYDRDGNFKRTWDAGAPCYSVKAYNGWLFIAAGNYVLRTDVNGAVKEKIGEGSFVGHSAIGLAVNTFGEVIATDVSVSKVLVFRR